MKQNIKVTNELDMKAMCIYASQQVCKNQIILHIACVHAKICIFFKHSQSTHYEKDLTNTEN